MLQSGSLRYVLCEQPSRKQAVIAEGKSEGEGSNQDHVAFS